MSEWDRLLPQAQLTLNLLRNSRINSKLSAYALLFGNFDFNKTPLAPPGTEVVIHSKPSNRASWEFHGKEGWYVGLSMEHYRCLKCFNPSSGKEMDIDTLKFFPHSTPLPQIATEDFLKQAATDIISILQKPPSATPHLQLTNTTRHALIYIARILNKAAPLEPIPSIESLPPLQSPVPSTTNPSTSPSTTTTLKSFKPVTVPRVHPAPKPVTVPRVHPAPEPLSAPTRHLSRDPSPPPVHPPNTLPRVLQKSSVPKTSTRSSRSTLKRLSPTIPKPYRLRARRIPNYRHLAAQHFRHIEYFSRPQVNHMYDSNGKRLSLDSLLTGKSKDIWQHSLGNEFGRLAQGIPNRVIGTDTIDFIAKHLISANKKVAYANFICDYRPLKSEPYRVRPTIGGDILPYYDDAGAPATSLLETKLLPNSVISDANLGAKFMSADIKDFFLTSPMKDPEYMRIHYRYFPSEIRQQYNLDALVDKTGFVYIKIKKGMHGLKQAAILAYNNLAQRLKPFGYAPCSHTTCLWTHHSLQTKFCLCVDDFGIKYFSKANAEHLLNALKQSYNISVDWTGKNYCCLTFDWNYTQNYVDVSMPNYVSSALLRLQHVPPSKPQYTPHTWTQPSFGRKLQLAPSDDSPLLNPIQTKHIQSVVGSFLYYARAVDPTMLPALNEIGAQQSALTQKTLAATKVLCDYASTYPNATIRYHASGMCLAVDSDAAYLVLPNARSRYAGYFYLTPFKPTPKFN